MIPLLSDFGFLFSQQKQAARCRKRRHHPAAAAQSNQVRMTGRVLRQILAAIGTDAPEQGGVIGMSKCGVISHFYHDISAAKTSVTYSPDIAGIRPVLAQWDLEDIRFCGMIHSHPGTMGRPSQGDVIYAERILKAMPRTLKGVLHMPIVTVDLRNRTAEIRWYLARTAANGSVRITSADLFVEGRRIRGALRTPLPAENGCIRNAGIKFPQKTEIRAC